MTNKQKFVKALWVAKNNDVALEVWYSIAGEVYQNDLKNRFTSKFKTEEELNEFLKSDEDLDAVYQPILKSYKNYDYYTVRANDGEFILALFDGDLKFDSMQIDLFLRTYGTKSDD